MSVGWWFAGQILFGEECNPEKVKLIIQPLAVCFTEAFSDAYTPFLNT